MRSAAFTLWHHGRSNMLECLEESCDFQDGPLTDRAATFRAQKHADATEHTVQQSQERFREIRVTKR